MEIFFQTFESVAALLGIGVLGFIIISRGVMPARALRFLSRLALEIALPCLIFVTIIENFNPAEYPQWWLLPGWWIGFTVAAGILTFGITRLVRAGNRPEFGLTLFYQNATFFPLAVITQLYGADSPYVVDLFLFVMLFGALLFSTYPLFFEGKLRETDWRKIFHPVFVVTLLAIIARLSGIHRGIPGFTISALDMVGQMTVPLLMLILGGSIYLDFQGQSRFNVSEMAKFVIFKNCVFPLVFFALLVLIRPSRSVALILLLEAAVPPVTAAPVLVKREGGNRALASQFLVASFIASLISLPAVVWLFEWQF